MAESTSSERAPGEREPGAPIGRDDIDPELVKLSRPRPKVGVITAAGLVFLCALFLVRLSADRRFAGQDTAPKAATPAEIVAGKLERDSLVLVTGEPVLAQAIRASKDRGGVGLRVAPVRGTGDRVWLAMSGDGWDPPALEGYLGRLRKLDDLGFADAVRTFAREHPRPVFATAAAIRAGFAGGGVVTVSGDRVAPSDRDAIALDVVDRNTATIAASVNERLPDAAAWQAALTRAELPPIATDPPDALGQIRFHVAASAGDATAKLERAELWAARVEPVTNHYTTTWAALRGSSPAGLAVGGKVLPDAEIELVGLYVTRTIPDDAYVVVAGENPEDYWYVLPITIALAVIGLVFAWALVRAVRRDLVPARAG